MAHLANRNDLHEGGVLVVEDIAVNILRDQAFGRLESTRETRSVHTTSEKRARLPAGNNTHEKVDELSRAVLFGEVEVQSSVHLFDVRRVGVSVVFQQKLLEVEERLLVRRLNDNPNDVERRIDEERRRTRCRT